MEPINTMLHALRPDTPGLLRRTDGLINTLRGIQQEASAEYWYKLAMALGADSETRLAYLAKSEGLLRYEIATIRTALKNESTDDKYRAIDSDGESWGYYFDTEIFYDSNQNVFARLHECYTCLANLTDSSVVKADMWIELAELLMVYDLPQLASKCYIISFAYDARIQTVIEERKLCSYHWAEGWDSHSDERILSHEKTIEMFPDYPNSYYSRSQKLSREGRYEAALNDLNSYSALSDDIGSDFYRHRGWLHYQLGNTFFARQDAANVLRLGGKLGAFLDGDWEDPDDPPF